MQRFAREARGHGVPEVMLAVARNEGRIPARVALVKSLASALCIGSGGSVGREGPIVQIGSALGSSIGQWLRLPPHRLRLLVACGAAGGISATFNAPIAGVFFALELILRSFTGEAFGIDVSPGAYGLIGMAAVFAGASHAPIAALVIVFELTGQYSIILPLMAAVALATGISYLVSRRTIHTLKLLRRGIDVDPIPEPDLLRTLTVADAMQDPPAPLTAKADRHTITTHLGRSRYAAAPVTSDNRYIGVVSATDADVSDNPSATARDLCVPAPPLQPEATLHDAMPLLHEHTGLPVLSRGSGLVVGWLDHRDVLAAYAQAHDNPPNGGSVSARTTAACQA